MLKLRIEKVKELYAAATARADANIKTREGINRQVIAIAQREQMVAEREKELREKEEEVTSTIERGRNELSSHDADLDTRETTIEADRKSLGDLHVDVLTRELTVKLKTSHLAFRERVLADREKQLAIM
jgi:uncharacterized protein (DUF3084 family)